MKRMSMVIVVLVVVIASLFGASLAGAQAPEEGRQTEGRRGARGATFQIISEVTGLDADALREVLQVEGATLASVIETNGGDVDAVIAQVVAAMVERTNGDAAEIEARVTEQFNTPFEVRDGEREGRGATFEIISEATGLDADTLREALQVEGATLASVIEANGGNVDDIIAQIVADIVERTDGDATEIEARITERFNTPFEAREGRRGPRGENAPEFDGDNA